METHQHSLAKCQRVDRDEYGSMIFRRGDYGILITKEEAFKYVTIITENSFTEDIRDSIEFEALYNSSAEEDQGTEGKGLHEILALAGTIVPQLLENNRII